MTREEAIAILNKNRPQILWEDEETQERMENLCKALDMAIKALEQESKQVELEGDGYADGELVYDYGKCPSCGWQFEDGDKDWEKPFCCHCGQKLTWFENEGDKECR